MATKAEIEVLLKLRDTMSKNLVKVNKELGRVSRGSKSATAASRGLQKGLDGMASRAGVAGQALASMGPAGLAAAAGMVAVGGALAVGIGNVVKLGDQITTLSAKTGISTDFLQKLQFAALKLDVPFEGATKAVSKLQINLGKLTPTKESLDALEQLGLSLDEVKNLDAEAQFLAVGDAIKALKAPTEQAAAAAALFGRSGIELLPALRDNFRGVLDEAESLGLVLSEDLLQAGDELGESWETMKKVIVALLSEGVGPLVVKLNELSVTWIALIQNAKEQTAELSAQMEAEGRLQSLIEAGLSQKEIEVALNEDRVSTARAYRDELAELARSENEAFEFAKANAVVLQDTASARVQDGIAARKQKKEVAELAGFVNKSIIEFEAMDAAFKSEAASAIKAAKAFEIQAREAEKLAKATEIVNQKLRDRAAIQGAVDLAAFVPEAIDTGGAGRRKAQAAAALQRLAIDLGVRGQELVREAIERTADETEKAEQAQQEYNRALQEAANLAQIIPGILGDIVSQSVAAAGALGNLSSASGSLGDLGKSFSGSGIGKALGKFGKVAGDLGPLIGIGVQLGTALVKGLSSVLTGGPDLVRDAARDMGATITKEMADAIEQSGRPLQLAVADLFQAGAFESADRFAQEIGDIFSGLESGAFGKPEAIQALEEAVPLLLQNLQDLGPAGEEEIQRIIAAAERLGVEFDGLSELINSTFAPQTLEEMKESLGLTGEEVRALAEKLGVDLQTNLERAAAQMGLTVAELKLLQEAAGTALGEEGAASLEQMRALMEATGLSAQELAERLGVDAAGGATSVAEEAAKGTAEISAAADQAGRLTQQLLSAAAAAAAIVIPGADGFDAGGGIPVETFAHGGDRIFTRPTLAMFGEAGPERVSFQPQGGGGGGGGGTVIQKVEVNLSVQGNILSTEEEIAAAIEGPTSRLILQSPEIQKRIRDAVE